MESKERLKWLQDKKRTIQETRFSNFGKYTPYNALELLKVNEEIKMCKDSITYEKQLQKTLKGCYTGHKMY